MAGRYFGHGRPVPCFLPDALDDLNRSGLLARADPNPMAGGMQRVAMTDTGLARYTALSEKEWGQPVTLPELKW